jgi:phosphoribosyl 1,2-cyclic phosphate phosphodiesterase
LSDTRRRRVGRAIVLGSGTSHGVPLVGCTCATCRSDDPRDRRWRPSLYLELAGGAGVLFDTTPDLRTQALTFQILRVDAVLFTHSHADHIMGLDEIRRYNAMQRMAIPGYGDARTIADVRRTFSYMFGPRTEGGGVPDVRLYPVTGPFSLARELVTPIPVMHGRRPILGYRLGSFAYLTDCSQIPDASWPLLEGVDLLVLDALRDRPHPTHFTVADALAVVDRLRPAKTYFTHICHDLPHAATSARLPEGVDLAYDGLQLDVYDVA